LIGNGKNAAVNVNWNFKGDDEKGEKRIGGGRRMSWAAPWTDTSHFFFNPATYLL
jgi:hypothetical protein